MAKKTARSDVKILAPARSTKNQHRAQEWDSRKLFSTKQRIARDLREHTHPHQKRHKCTYTAHGTTFRHAFFTVRVRMHIYSRFAGNNDSYGSATFAEDFTLEILNYRRQNRRARESLRLIS